jgi:pimeloyl-ACP methyl ester carboxylesterase
MTTHRRWFRSGGYLLLGHTDVPETRGDMGVVIVPPFGFEDVCSHRALRHLAGMLAANGIPTLRFDLPAAGDSSGGPLDSGLLESWVASVAAAAAELREIAGVARVAVFGVHLGATLALMAAAAGADIQDLILWGPVSMGRSALRELRAYARMQRPEIPGDDPPPEPPVAGLEVAGFLLTPETQQALERIDLTALPAMPGRRVLLLSRDSYAPETKLVNALEAAGCAVTVQTGEGYAAMMAAPHDSVPPLATGRIVVEYMAGQCAQQEPPAHRSSVTAAPVPIDGAVESVFTAPGAPALFGVISEPPPGTPPAGLCILLLNAGADRHIGPNRMWVEAARRWAARGIASVRLDLPGIGESDGERSGGVEGLYRLELVEEVERAMRAVAVRLGNPRFGVAGLCSGAFWAFHAAVRNPEIRTAFLLNARLFFWDPEVDRRRVLRRTAKGLTELRDWRRLLLGRVCSERFRQIADAAFVRIRSIGRAPGRVFQIPPEPMAKAWEALERNQSRMSLIFSQNEPLLAEMEEEGQLPPKRNTRIRCIRIPQSDHTFCPLHAQKRVHEILDRELEAALHESAPATI